jgi:hypothetical protein
VIEDERLDLDVTKMKNARPFPYLVLESLFSEDLLQAVAEEFDTHDGWRTIDNHGQRIQRSLNSERFGPATEAYLAAANSARFVSYLRALSGFPHLIADAMAERGGLHETRNGGFLKVHRDFADHKGNDLRTSVILSFGTKPDVLHLYRQALAELSFSLILIDLSMGILHLFFRPMV